METTLTTQAGTDLSSQLGFTAHTVVIDNITNAWATVPATGRQIAPWQHSVVVAIPGTQRADVRWQTPPGILKAAYDTTQQLIATYSSDQLPSSLGQPTQQPGNAGILLGTFPATGASTTSQQFPIPQGVDALFVMIDSASGWPAGTQVIVADPTLTRIYGDFTPLIVAPEGTGWLLFPVEPSIDPNVVVIVKTTGGPFTIRVLAITHPALMLATILGNELPLTIVGPGGGANIGQPINTYGSGQPPTNEAIATHATATIPLVATPGLSWHISWISAGYTAPSSQASAIQVITAGITPFDARIPTASMGPFFFPFPDGGINIGVNTAATVSLLDGGAGIIGTIQVGAVLLPY
ncbi:MAG TPA: hypothetical protein VGY32_11510 [Solirubrobacteraceae bacterium]|nr:hypothetical protein [Solirubrobacteraceae bacterium]